MGGRCTRISFRGALATHATEYAVPTLFTQDANDTAALLFLIARREQQAAEGVSASDDFADRRLPRGYRKASDLRGQQLQVLEALPLVGRHRAQQLLDHFGAIEQLASATEQELDQVPSIGLKTARRIKEILGAALSKRAPEE